MSIVFFEAHVVLYFAHAYVTSTAINIAHAHNKAHPTILAFRLVIEARLSEPLSVELAGAFLWYI